MPQPSSTNYFGRTASGLLAPHRGLSANQPALDAARLRQRMSWGGNPSGRDQELADRWTLAGPGGNATQSEIGAFARQKMGMEMDVARRRAAFEGELQGIKQGAARQAAEGGTGEPLGPRVGLGPRRFSMGGPVLGEQRGPRVGVGGPVLGEQRGLRFGMGGPVIGRGFEGVGFEGGGPVDGPGTSKSDSIPAWLSDDEYVIKAEAVKKYGENTFEALNEMRVPKGKVRGFYEGGPARWGREEPKRKFQVPGGELARRRYDQSINPLTNRQRFPTAYRQAREIEALQKQGYPYEAGLLAASYKAYDSGDVDAIEEAERNIIEHRKSLAAQAAKDAGSKEGNDGQRRGARRRDRATNAPAEGANPPPAAPSFGSTLQTMGNTLGRSIFEPDRPKSELPLPGTARNPSSGTVEKLTPTSAEVRYPSGRGSVNYGPRKEPAMIEGIPAQQWFQEAANRQRQGNRYAQPTLQAQYQNKYAGEPGYPGGPPMSAQDEQAWAAAAGRFGSTRRAR